MENRIIRSNEDIELLGNSNFHCGQFIQHLDLHYDNFKDSAKLKLLMGLTPNIKALYIYGGAARQDCIVLYGTIKNNNNIWKFKKLVTNYDNDVTILKFIQQVFTLRRNCAKIED